MKIIHILLLTIIIGITACSTNKVLSKSAMSPTDMKAAIKIRTMMDESGAVDVTMINTSSDTINTKDMYLHILQVSSGASKTFDLTKDMVVRDIYPGKRLEVSLKLNQKIAKEYNSVPGKYGTSITYASMKPLPNTDPKVLFYIYYDYPNK